MTVKDILQAKPIMSIKECLLTTIRCLPTWCRQQEEVELLCWQKHVNANGFFLLPEAFPLGQRSAEDG